MIRLSVPGIMLSFGLVIASCSSDSQQGSLSPQHAVAADSIEGAVLELLRTALTSTIETRGEPGERVVIRSDITQPDGDPLEAYGLSVRTMASRLATTMNVQALPRDEVIVCEGEVGPRNPHPCHINFDGGYYSLTVSNFTPHGATVAVHRNGGTRVMDLVRGTDGWEIVRDYDIAS